MRLLVFLPCLNEQETLPDVIAKIPRTIDGLAQVDVLVVDDGSTDDSAAVARGCGASVVSNGTNLGVGLSFQVAVKYAIENRYDAMVNIDADGQFDPHEIPLLVKPIVDGAADFVAGSRFLSGGEIPHMPKLKHWGNRHMSGLISRLAGQKFSDVSCGFRAYGREALLRLNLHGRFTYTQESFLDLASHRLRIKEVPIHVRYFPERTSRVAGSIPKYALKTLDIIVRTYRDYHPLRFFGLIAVANFVIGAGFLLFLLRWYLESGMFTPHIWSGFVGAAFTFAALIFGVLGLMADMLTRVRRNQERILYEVRGLRMDRRNES